MANEQNAAKNNIPSQMKENNESIIIPGYSTIDEFIKDGFKTLVEATKTSNSLPQDRDWDFYNTHQSFRDLMSSVGDINLRLINDVLKQQGIQGNIKSRDFEEKIEMIIEANDIILERVANNLDEIAGIRKNPELPLEIQTVSAELPVNGSWNRLNNSKISVATSSAVLSQNQIKSSNSIRLLTAINIQRPQKFFKDKIDNSNAPWEPQIKDKPNNLKPLAIFLEETSDGLGEIYSHPYEFELERFTPHSWQLIPRPKPIPLPKPLSETPLHIVDTSKGLSCLLEKLRSHREIAIDLEHHNYRSFLGFTCLMQISTIEEDFLVDTLVLRDQLHVLNEIFTKNTILKIFHGAEHDIEWLQRDLSLYVVNMFDTHEAAKQLGYPHLSLAYLLRKFCNVDANKSFQLADWRIRPLPEELKTYAREDTHYLIYIANLMCNELLEKGENVLRAVYTSSTQVCMRRYVKPIIHETSHLELYRRCKKLFDNRQMYALKHLYTWRNSIAREEDESTGFVLPNHMLLQIAELLPREMQGILACCSPIPPLVRSNLLELHRIVLKAREQSINKPILSEEARSRGSTQQHSSKMNVDSLLNCPHELPRSEEFRDDLPCLLGIIRQNLLKQNLLETQKAKLSVFDSPENSDCEKEKKNKVNIKMKRLKFLGPYERYKLVKKYVIEEEKQQENKNNEQIENQEIEKIENQGNRTDNDRIEALHKHFKNLAASTLQIVPSTSQQKSTQLSLPEEHSLLTLGQPSAKKRKRETSPEASEETETPISLRQQRQIWNRSNQHVTPLNSNQQPNAPNSSGKKKKKKKKKNMQALNEQLHNKGQNTQQQQSKDEQNNKQHTQQQTEEQQQQNKLKKRQKRSQQFKKFKKQQVQNNSEEIKRELNSNNTSPRGKRKWQNDQPEVSNPKRNRNSNENNADNREFKPFDYSAVDFRQFQGGARSANQDKKMSTSFRGKGSKNKKFDKIEKNNTRSSNSRGRGGRGGGRNSW